MTRRGKILRDANAGPGLLTVEGKQYVFTLENMWTSDIPPRSGMTVEVTFNPEGAPEAVNAVPETQLAKEGAAAAFADARRQSGEMASGLTSRVGKATPIAILLLLICWYLLPALSIQLPYSGANVSFWGLLHYLNAPNPALVMGQDSSYLSAGIWGLLAVISAAAPLLPFFWKDRRGVFGGVLPLAFMLIVLFSWHSSMNQMTAPAHAGGGLADFGNALVGAAAQQVARQTSLAFGAYASLLCSLYLGASAIRRYLVVTR